MKQLNILGPDAWLHKFPHWRVLCATIAEDEKREALEEVHRAVATQIKGYEEGPELDRHIAQKRKTKKWNTLVFGAPTPYDPRYPETMPTTKRYTNCFDDDWDVDPEEEAAKARAKLRPKQQTQAKAPPQTTKGGVRAAAPEVEEETPRMSLEEVVAGVSKLSNKLVGSVVDVDAPLLTTRTTRGCFVPRTTYPPPLPTRTIRAIPHLSVTVAWLPSTRWQRQAPTASRFKR